MKASKFEKAQELRNNGEIVDALILYSEARDEFLKEKDLKGGAECLHMIGVAYYQESKFEEAEKYLQLALGEFIESNDIESQGFVFRDLGMVARGQKDIAKAKEYYLESIKLLHKVGNIGHEGMSHVKLGKLIALEGKLDEAFTEINKGIKMLEKSKEKFFLAGAYVDRAQVDAQKALSILNSFSTKDEFKKMREKIDKIFKI